MQILWVFSHHFPQCFLTVPHSIKQRFMHIRRLKWGKFVQRKIGISLLNTFLLPSCREHETRDPTDVQRTLCLQVSGRALREDTNDIDGANMQIFTTHIMRMNNQQIKNLSCMWACNACCLNYLFKLNSTKLQSRTQITSLKNTESQGTALRCAYMWTWHWQMLGFPFFLKIISGEYRDSLENETIYVFGNDDFLLFMIPPISFALK